MPVKQVDLFETDHTSMVKPGADLRKNHIHQGHPALAPDGRVISFEGRTFEGSDKKALEKGIINFEDLPKCKGYNKWVREKVPGNGGDGGPYPDQEALDIMNAYEPKPGPGPGSRGGGQGRRRKTGGGKRRKGTVKGSGRDLRNMLRRRR